jgi:hypothetical protein
MTPKEKAQELLDKFKEINEDYIDNYQSIPCALIAVDEIIKVFNPEKWGLEMNTAFESIEYWQKVKKEIELL